MNAQNLAIDDGSDVEAVEHFGAVFPGIGASVFALALVIETINLRDLARFVIAAEQSDFVRISCFEEQKDREGLDAVVPAIHKITHEDVTCCGHFSSTLEELEQIKKLAVNIAAHCDGRADRLHIALFQKNIFHHLAKALEVLLGQVLALFDFFNPFVEIDGHV